MNHFILGTAGHIDHGKTTLVKALTGFDCDTHREEKLRGITINLGFTCLELPDGSSLGIVDVPGHKDFVNTMVTGASGIDIVMLVIAADAGVMPQTVEHLQIMNILGVKTGCVVLSKIDLVDREILAMAREEIHAVLKDTFLQGCPILEVSALSGSGLPELLSCLQELTGRAEPRKKGEIFRLPIDRIFTVKGFGTVVNGSVIGGELHSGQKVYLLPGEKELKIRRLERHGQQVAMITTGDRASLNLTGLQKDEFDRGMIITDRILPLSRLLDVRLTLFSQVSPLRLWTQVIFLLGTLQTQARIHLLDRDRLAGGETALVQIHLEKEYLAVYGDRFVIRNTAGDTTLGGGEVIDSHPLHHRRRPAHLIRELQQVSSGTLVDRIITEVRKKMSPVTPAYLAALLNVEEDAVRTVAATALPATVSLLSDDRDVFLFQTRLVNAIRNKILNHLETYHKRNPLDAGGRTGEEIRGIFNIQADSDQESLLKIILKEMEKEKLVARIANTWTLFGHRVVLTAEDEKHIEFIEHYLRSSGMKTPLMSEMVPRAYLKGIGENRLRQILRLLSNRRQAYNIDGNFIHKIIVDRCRHDLLKYLNNSERGITIAEFRDLVQGNRKICLLLMSLYDSEGIVIRRDDQRFISDKGRNLLKNL